VEESWTKNWATSGTYQKIAHRKQSPKRRKFVQSGHLARRKELGGIITHCTHWLYGLLNALKLTDLLHSQYVDLKRGCFRMGYVQLPWHIFNRIKHWPCAYTYIHTTEVCTYVHLFQSRKVLIMFIITISK
jgi:hypothetical protein